MAKTELDEGNIHPYTVTKKMHCQTAVHVEVVTFSTKPSSSLTFSCWCYFYVINYLLVPNSILCQGGACNGCQGATAGSDDWLWLPDTVNPCD
jgi:hypothetical protein